MVTMIGLEKIKNHGLLHIMDLEILLLFYPKLLKAIIKEVV
jgi:hypothetical protein